MTLMEKAHATISVSAVQELSQEDLELISGGKSRIYTVRTQVPAPKFLVPGSLDWARANGFNAIFMGKYFVNTKITKCDPWLLTYIK